jgi:hypothetical protein
MKLLAECVNQLLDASQRRLTESENFPAQAHIKDGIF